MTEQSNVVAVAEAELNALLGELHEASEPAVADLRAVRTRWFDRFTGRRRPSYHEVYARLHDIYQDACEQLEDLRERTEVELIAHLERRPAPGAARSSTDQWKAKLSGLNRVLGRLDQALGQQRWLADQAARHEHDELPDSQL